MAKPERANLDLIERGLMGFAFIVVLLILIDSNLRRQASATPAKAESAQLESPQRFSAVMPASQSKSAQSLHRPVVARALPANERCIEGVRFRRLVNGWEQIGSCEEPDL